MAKYSYPNIPSSLILDPPNQDLKISVCIPCYNESDVISTIRSLADCDQIDGSVEVIILINEPSDVKDEVTIQNQKSYEDCSKLNKDYDEKSMSLIPIYVSQIAIKKAGVGYARRLAMDEANIRFKSLGNDRGIIACLDADTTVSKNYLIEIIKFFGANPKLTACSIAFAHDLNISDQKIRSAICDYESHLRYFINMQRLIGLPFAYQTVGSAMAVTSNSYLKQGGMNTRKAGEDFYFLHKFIKNGLVSELNTACVYPSSRVSDRVPFGTGKAVGDIIKSDEKYLTYSPQSFFEIDKLVRGLLNIYSEDDYDLTNLCVALKGYLTQESFIDRINEIKANTTNYESFEKRFFQWFDAFRLMKCLHYLRDNAYANIEIADAIMILGEKLGIDSRDDKYENLKLLRNFDKNYQA